MRVLLVENDVRYRAAISVELKAEAVRVDIAESGDDALYLMRHYDFDLMLLNMLLPDMSGTSLISRIRLAELETPSSRSPPPRKPGSRHSLLAPMTWSSATSIKRS